MPRKSRKKPNHKSSKKPKQIKAIYQDFLAKVEKIKETRDKRIFAIIKKAEQKQIEELKRSFK